MTLFPAVWLALGSRTQGSAHPVKVERAWQSLAVDICALRILAHQRESLACGDWVAPGNTTPRFHLAPDPQTPQTLERALHGCTMVSISRIL